jgi:hypothetical protein
LVNFFEVLCFQINKNIYDACSPKDIWHILDGERIVIQFNAAYQPTGLGSKKFRRICGKIVRNGRFIQLHGNWRKLSPEGKEEMCLALTVRKHSMGFQFGMRKKFYMEL